MAKLNANKHNVSPRDLLSLYDEYLELNESCAFLCDAVCALAETEAQLDHYSVNGLRHHSRNIKIKLLEFGESVETLRVKAVNKASDT